MLGGDEFEYFSQEMVNASGEVGFDPMFFESWIEMEATKLARGFRARPCLSVSLDDFLGTFGSCSHLNSPEARTWTM